MCSTTALPPSWLISAGIELPQNVSIVYTAFSQAAQKEEFAAWRDLWYKSFLPAVLSSSTTSPMGFVKVDGGLPALQKASEEVFDGKMRGKVIINPQE